MVDAYFSETIDKMKESLLLSAAQGGNTQDCEALIEFGANINWRNAEGDTPLIAATRRGHTETIALLLAHGADSNVCAADSYTPLHIATRRGDAISVDLLLNANTDRSTRTRDGQTALDIARAKGYENIYARLMEKRSSLPRTVPAAAQTLDAASALINNVRNELPVIQSTRGASASGGIVGELRQLRNFDRLMSEERASKEDAQVGSGPSSSRRRRAEAGSMLSSSLDFRSSVGPSSPRAAGSNDAHTMTERERKQAAASTGHEPDSSPRAGRSAEEGRPHPSSAAAASASRGSALGAPQQTVSRADTASRSAVPAAGASLGAPSSASVRSSSTGTASAHTPANQGYSIMGTAHDGHTGSGPSGGGGRGVVAGDETAVIALRKILDQEIATRKTLEIKLAVFKDQNTQLLEEFALLSQQLTTAQDSYNELEAQLFRLLGEPAALENATIEECEELENRLKNALQKIDAKKTALIKSRIGNQNEQRMCVVCQDNEKSVVLLPCRHMCVCAPCSEHAQLKNCPLCREAIVHKISVFA